MKYFDSWYIENYACGSVIYIDGTHVCVNFTRNFNDECICE